MLLIQLNERLQVLVKYRVELDRLLIKLNRNMKYKLNFIKQEDIDEMTIEVAMVVSDDFETLHNKIFNDISEYEINNKVEAKNYYLFHSTNGFDIYVDFESANGWNKTTLFQYVIE